jgi:hypothetical protein
MHRSCFTIYSVEISNSEAFIGRQYCQYQLYLYPDISVETQIWTVVALHSIQRSIPIQRSLLNVNIVNIHCICTLIFPLEIQY